MSTIKVDSVETTDDTKVMRFSTNSTEAMRIDTDGNVGIGTDSPLYELVVEGSTGVTRVGVTNTVNAVNGAGIQFSTKNGDTLVSNATLRTDNAGNFSIFTGTTGETERMHIDSNGNVGFGTSPAYRLDVDSNGWGAAARFSRLTDGQRRGVVYFRSSTNDTGIGEIAINDNSTSYETSSDYRLKTDVQPMTGASARVQALNPVNFEWIAGGSRTDGFIAHEAQAVVPECASGTKDAVDEDGNPKYQGIDQSKLVPLLTAALQEALTRIEALESKA
jgi:hypothetical protein